MRTLTLIPVKDIDYEQGVTKRTDAVFKKEYGLYERVRIYYTNLDEEREIDIVDIS